MKRKYRPFTAVFPVLLFLFLPLRGQEDGGSPWRIKGFADTYHALRTESPGDWMSSRTRLRGEIAREAGPSSLFVSFNATYNTLLKNRPQVELREVYLDYRASHWGLRAGRQLIIWGAADGMRITDLVSPMDMTEFLAQDYDDIRMPVNALRFFVFNEKVKAEAIVVPAFEGYVFPTDAANPWSVIPASVRWEDAGSIPRFRLSNVEYGGRISFTLPGIDFSVAGLHTWNKMPVLQYGHSGTDVVISPRHYRMGFVGGDFSKPIGPLVIRGEAACNIGKHFTYAQHSADRRQRGFNTLNWLVGIDWYAANDWILMVQLSAENIFGYESYIAQPRNRSFATFNIQKKWLAGTLLLSDFAYYDISRHGWFNRCSADYALTDQVHLMGGFDWFGGHDDSMFGIYKNNSQVWMKAKYNF